MKIWRSFQVPAGRSGHLRVTVSSSEVTVDYVRAFLLEAENAERINGQVSHTYFVAHPHTKESLNNLIPIYEACDKPERAYEWRVKLPQMEGVREWHKAHKVASFRSRKTLRRHGDFLLLF